MRNIIFDFDLLAADLRKKVLTLKRKDERLLETYERVAEEAGMSPRFIYMLSTGTYKATPITTNLYVVLSWLGESASKYEKYI